MLIDGGGLLPEETHLVDGDGDGDGELIHCRLADLAGCRVDQLVREFLQTVGEGCSFFATQVGRDRMNPFSLGPMQERLAGNA